MNQSNKAFVYDVYRSPRRHYRVRVDLRLDTSAEFAHPRKPGKFLVSARSTGQVLCDPTMQLVARNVIFKDCA